MAGTSHSRGRRNRLHALRVIDPTRNGKVIGILRPCAPKAGVVEKKLDYVALPGTRLAGNGFQ